MGYGGRTFRSIGQPWLSAGYYAPNADQNREETGNPADPPEDVVRAVGPGGSIPASIDDDIRIINQLDFRQLNDAIVPIHNAMHSFVAMGGAHISFRDPFVFLLHSNVDRLFALWQHHPDHPERLTPGAVYGSSSNNPVWSEAIPPWSGRNVIGGPIRPWAPPENLVDEKTYKHPSVVIPRRYSPRTPQPNISLPASISFGNVAQRDVVIRQLRIKNTGFVRLSVSINASQPPPEGQPLSGFRWNRFRREIFPGETASVIVQFSPRAEGAFTGRMRVESNDADGPQIVTLRGRGLPRDIPPPFTSDSEDTPLDLF